MFKGACTPDQLRKWYRLKRSGMSAWCAYKDSVYAEKTKKRETGGKGNTRPQSSNKKPSVRPEKSVKKQSGGLEGKNKRPQKVATA